MITLNKYEVMTIERLRVVFTKGPHQCSKEEWYEICLLARIALKQEKCVKDAARLRSLYDIFRGKR